MNEEHREFKKSFETEIKINGKNLPLNHFIQETVANMMVGLLQTLKEVEDTENTVEIKIRRLDKTTVVDAHTYP